MVKKGMLKKSHFDNSVLFCLESVIVEGYGVIHIDLNYLFVCVCYLEEKEQLKKCSPLDNNHTDIKNLQKFNFFKFCIETNKLYEIFTINAIL